ncbi:GrpB family protein [candidate division KSB1 bacterium]|nr:GrpB family protein [candidate division KSB1 bacterium]
MILHDYTPTWKEEFERLKAIYLESLGDTIIAIEHIGSTSIPGIKAKPILDVDIVIENYEIFPTVVDRLARLGYTHNGDQGILHREAFKRKDEFTPESSPRRKWMNHHLYVCPEFSEELKRQLIFRDTLRIDERAKRAYEAIKIEIAARADGDRKRYAAIKEAECREFVEKTLAAAGYIRQVAPS